MASGRIRARAGRSARESRLPAARVDPRQLAADIARHLLPTPKPSKPFGSLAETWERAHLRRVAASTQPDVRCSVAALTAAFGELGPEALTPELVEEYLAALKTKHKRPKPAGARTKNKHRQVGMQILEAAIKRGDWTGPNAFELVQPIPLRKKKGHVLKPDEAWQLIWTVGPLHRCAFACALYTTARKGEFIEWRREDLDLQEAVFHVRRSCGNDFTKNGDQRENLPIHRELLPFLVAHLASHRSQWVFPRADGSKQRADWDLAAVCRRAVARAGILAPDGTPKNITFHGLRRCAATLYKQAGTDNLVRKLLMGHAVRDVTDETYTSLDVPFMRREIEKMSLRPTVTEERARPDLNGEPLASKADGHHDWPPPNSEPPRPLAGTVLSYLAERFWAKVDRSGDCWIWQGRRDNLGQYGVFRLDRREVRAHRFSVELSGRSIPEGMVVMHTCDNPPCVNPAHLVVGTRTDNRADCVAKDRQAKGEQNGRAKLTAEQVREIRRLRPTTSGAELARRFGVSRRAIRFAVDGTRWAHVDDGGDA